MSGDFRRTCSAAHTCRGGRGRAGRPSAYRPVWSRASEGSGWRWIWSGRCSSPQTGGCSCPRCWTAFCWGAVKSSSVILASDSHCRSLSVVPVCHAPKPPPSRPPGAREGDYGTKELGGGPDANTQVLSTHRPRDPFLHTRCTLGWTLAGRRHPVRMPPGGTRLMSLLSLGHVHRPVRTAVRPRNRFH